MATLDEITSTEKLLDVIRKGKGRPAEGDAAGGGQAPDTESREDVPSPKGWAGKGPPGHKPVTVGVDIGHEYLRLVKTSGSAEGRWKLIDYVSIPLLKVGGSTETPEFVNFLRTELTAFCGSPKKLNLWAIMSAARVDVHHVKIPRVAKKDIENAVYWTVKKDVAFNEKETIFDFEVHGEVIDQGMPKLSVMAYTAPAREVEDLEKVFMRAGFPLSGISITPFAFQNIFRTRWVDIHESTIASLYIGNEFSRIDIYSGGNLVMTRGIKAGTNSMVECLMEEFNDRRWARPGINDGNAKMGFEQARKVFLNLCVATPLADKDIGRGLTSDEIFELVLPALGRLVRQVERTFEYFGLNGGDGKVERVYLSAAMSLPKSFVDYTVAQLGIQGDVWDLMGVQARSAATHLKPISADERAGFTPALGIALSDNSHTPNFMFSFSDKEQAASVTRINRAVFLVFIAVVILCSGIFSYQRYALGAKKTLVTTLQKQMTAQGPRADQNAILQLAAKGRAQRQTVKMQRDRYLGASIVGELSALTPPNVRLLNLKMNLGSYGGQKDVSKTVAKDAIQDKSETVTLEGIIQGDRRALESTLTGYVLKLDGSPMFRQVNVQKGVVEKFRKEDVLRFVIDMRTG